jgi:hypothetical protein
MIIYSSQSHPSLLPCCSDRQPQERQSWLSVSSDELDADALYATVVSYADSLPPPPHQRQQEGSSAAASPRRGGSAMAVSIWARRGPASTQAVPPEGR